MIRAAIPAVTLAVTVWCAHGLDVSPTVFLSVWAGLTGFVFGLRRFVLDEWWTG